MHWRVRKCATSVRKDALVILDVPLTRKVPFGITKYQLISCAPADSGVRCGVVWHIFSYKIAISRAHIANECLFGRESGARSDLRSRRWFILLRVGYSLISRHLIEGSPTHTRTDLQIVRVCCPT